jgi:hypothetical protein
VLNFDYKAWGDSDGAKTRLAPYSRVADVQAALTFMGAQPQVNEARLGIYGTSYGGATVVFVAAIDPRVKCVVSVVGIGNGARWMRSVRRPDEYHDSPPWTVSSVRSPATPSLPTATTSCCRTASRPNWARRRGATIQRQ